MTRRLLHAAPALVAASAVGLLLVALTGFGTGWVELVAIAAAGATTALLVGFGRLVGRQPGRLAPHPARRPARAGQHW